MKNLNQPILREISEKSNKNERHYRNNNGTATCIVSNTNMNYYDESEQKWKHTDNSMVEKDDFYEANLGRFKARLYKTAEKCEVSVFGENVSVSWRYLGMNKPKARKGAAKIKAKKSQNVDMLLGSEITYKNANEGIDIQYIMLGNNVKENIIVRKKQDDYNFKYEYNVIGLELRKSENGNALEFYSPITNKVEFSIPAPHMYDATGTNSVDAYYEIEPKSNNTYLVTVVASSEWINSPKTKLPVTVDPQLNITTEQTITCYTDCFLYSSSSNPGDSGFAGTITDAIQLSNTGTVKTTAVIEINTKNINVDKESILSACLNLTAMTENTSIRVKCLVYVDGNFAEQTYQTWGDIVSIPITEYLKNSNSNIEILFYLDEYSPNAYIYNTYSKPPKIEIDYIDETQQTSNKRTFSLVAGAVEYLDIFTGDSVTVLPAVNDDNMGVSISNILKESNENYCCGDNIRLNIHETLIKNTDSELKSNYIYTDGYGDKHYFKETFYYTDEYGKKIAITDKSKIEISLDGKLLYSNGTRVYEVKRTEATFDGMKATTKLEGFKNIDLFEQRTEEQKQMEEQIDSYKSVVSKLVVVNEDYSLDCKTENDLSNIEKIKHQVERDGTKYLLTEDEFNSLKSILSQTSVINRNISSIEQSIELSKVSLTNNLNSLLSSKNALLLQQALNNVDSNDSMKFDTIEKQISTILSGSKRNLSYLEYLFHSITDEFDNKDTVPVDSVEKALAEYNRKIFNSYKVAECDGTIYEGIELRFNSSDEKWEIRLLDPNSDEVYPYSDMTLLKTREGNDMFYVFSPSEIDSLRSLSLALKQKDMKSTGEILNDNNEIVSIDLNNSVIIAKQIEDIEAQINLVQRQLDALEETPADNNNKNGDLITQKTILETQREEAEEQIALIKARSEDNIELFLKYYKELSLLNEELNTLKKNLPVNYIMNDSGAKGFNENGNLVVIYDTHNRYIILEYEKYYTGIQSGYRVSRLVDNKENTICFHYDENSILSEIVDSLGKTTKFEYSTNSNGYLFYNITYSDGTSLDISKKTNFKTVLSTDYETSEIRYSDSKISSIVNLSKVNSVAHNTIERSAHSKTISHYSINFSDCFTEILDDSNNGYECSFSFDGQILEEHEIKAGLITSAVKYSYDLANLVSVIYPTESCLDVAQGNFVFVDEYEKTIKYDEFDKIVNDETGYMTISDGTQQAIKNEYTYDEKDRLVKKRTTVTTITNGNTSDDYKVELFEYDKYDKLLCKKSYTEGKELISGIFVEEHIYDKNGYEIKTVTYNSLDPSSKLYNETEINEDGHIIGVFDQCGMFKTTYDNNTVIQPNGAKVSNCTEYHSGNSAITMSTEEGEENSTQRLYTKGLLTKVISGDNVYEYTYDHKGRETSVSINGQLHISYSYEDRITENDKTVNKVTAIYVNGDNVTVTEDLNGNILSVNERPYDYDSDASQTELNIINRYDNKHRVTQKTDISINDSVIYGYEYDAQDRVTSYSQEAIAGSSLPYSEEFLYDERGNLIEKVVNYNSETVDTATYEYDETTRKLKKINFAGSTRIEPKLDCLGRNRGKTVYCSGAKIYSEDITYLKHGDHATNMPLTISYGNNTENGFVVKDRIKYKYDEMGNICEVYENGQFVTEYKYDALGRLVRENNKQFGKTFVFSYDNKGNILTRTEYAFTLKDDDFVKEATGEVFEYVYSGEKLVSYNGEAFAYDEIGNPTMYRGNTLTWRFGRRLTSFGANTFDYNAEGKRIKKNNISYIYDSQGRLFAQSNGIEYFYDENSSPIAFAYLGEVYYYKKDLLGNVIEILDTTGTTVVKYTYDAWGNHKVLNPDGTESTDNTFVGNINPIRYRSYYFDTETGLYFLQTRYYDPQIGRFINIDDISYLEPESINGLNLYAYCLNNPIKHIDPNGNFVITIGSLITAAIIGAVVGGAIGGVYGGVTAASTGQNIFAGIMIGILGGAIMGAGAGVAGVFLAPAMAGASITFATATGATFVMGTAISTTAAVAIGIGTAFVSGAIGGAVVDVATQLANYGTINSVGSIGISALQWGVINTLNAFLGSSIEALSIFDIGIGFSKTAATIVSIITNITTGKLGLDMDVFRSKKG